MHFLMFARKYVYFCVFMCIYICAIAFVYMNVHLCVNICIPVCLRECKYVYACECPVESLHICSWVDTCGPCVSMFICRCASEFLYVQSVM